MNTDSSSSAQTSGRPLTRNDLARLAGVSSCTVSMAMQNNPKVAAATRKRIQRLAAETGYVVDPVGTLLARRRLARRRPEARILIAVLSDDGVGEETLLDTAKALGVDVMPVRVDADVPPRILLDRLWAQGVLGILLGSSLPWGRDALQEAPWGRFSVLKSFRIHPELPFSFVRHAPFDYAMLALENLRRAGCRRIAAILAESGSRIDDDARAGAVYAFAGRYAAEGVRTALRTERGVAEISAETLRWLREGEPDGVLIFHAHMAIPLREAGFRLPDDFPCAAILALPQYLPEVSGCDVRLADYARLELRALLDMVGAGERGFADPPIQHVLDPVWHPGATCPVAEPMAFLL